MGSKSSPKVKVPPPSAPSPQRVSADTNNYDNYLKMRKRMGREGTILTGLGGQTQSLGGGGTLGTISTTGATGTTTASEAPYPSLYNKAFMEAMRRSKNPFTRGIGEIGLQLQSKMNG